MLSGCQIFLILLAFIAQFFACYCEAHVIEASSWFCKTNSQKLMLQVPGWFWKKLLTTLTSMLVALLAVNFFRLKCVQWSLLGAYTFDFTVCGAETSVIPFYRRKWRPLLEQLCSNLDKFIVIIVLLTISESFCHILGFKKGLKIGVINQVFWVTFMITELVQRYFKRSSFINQKDLCMVCGGGKRVTEFCALLYIVNPLPVSWNLKCLTWLRSDLSQGTIKVYLSTIRVDP